MADAGVRVQTVAVLMSRMQSEMVGQELIGSPHYFLPAAAALSPLLSLLDTECHTMTSDSERHLKGSRQVGDRFASRLVLCGKFPVKLRQKLGGSVNRLHSARVQLLSPRSINEREFFKRP